MGNIELFLFLPSSCRFFCQPGFHRQASFLSQRAVKESPVPKQVTQAVLIQFYYYTRNYPKVSSAINMLFLPPPLLSESYLYCRHPLHYSRQRYHQSFCPAIQQAASSKQVHCVLSFLQIPRYS